MLTSRTPAPPAGRSLRGSARDKLIVAAHQEVRRQGYAATTVDQICTAAGVTKGAFFHHFESKEALAIAAAEAWTERARPMFEMAPHTKLQDPLDRLLGHIDFRFSLLHGPVDGFTCFIGTMVQDAYATSEPIRLACEASIAAYCDALAPDIEAAMAAYGAPAGMTAHDLARHVQSVLQGSFVLAKTTNDPATARESVLHLTRYVKMLFGKI